MSDRYEIRHRNDSSRGRYWEGYWRVYDAENRRFVSIGFESLDEAERCRNALIRDDQHRAT